MKEQGLELNESARLLINGLAETLAQVLESMTDRRPEVEWSARRGRFEELEPGAEVETLWWEQSFQTFEKPALWLGAPRGAWEDLGSRTLRAAGLETVELADARSTWLEILSQAVSAVARMAGQKLGHEVTCTQGAERQPPGTASEWIRIQVSFDAPLPPLWATLGAELVDQLEAAASRAPADESAVDAQAASRTPAGSSRTMELLLDVELPVSISFGRSQLPLKDVLKLTTGSIVELNRTVSEPVEVLVNDSLIARGEVVVVDGNYAVRIQHIVSLQDRLRSVR
jgi:flagellar motor switch protein FliN